MVSQRAREVDVAVGGRVHLRRVMLRMCQKDLASAIGIDVEQLQKYEAGEERFGPPLLVDCANVLKVPVTWFFEDAFSGRYRHANECLVLVQYYQSIRDPKERSMLLESARKMAEGG